MGNPKQKWTAEEEQALKEGVAKHGPGKWKCILKDPHFHQHLSNRTNIDLKDKWRNMSAGVQGSSTRTPKPKLTQYAPARATPTPPVNIQTPLVLPVAHEPVINPITGDYVKDPLDFKTGSSRYNNEIHALIFEALSVAKEQNGLDIVSILRYMEERITFDPPQGFRKQLAARLRRLVQQDRLEKVEHCYRLKNFSLGETDSSNGKDIWPKPFIPDHIKYSEPLEEAAKTAAFKVFEAEKMSYLAASSVREAEMLSKMQEEADSLFQLAHAICKRFKCDHNKVLLVS